MNAVVWSCLFFMFCFAVGNDRWNEMLLLGTVLFAVVTDPVAWLESWLAKRCLLQV